jgi:prepilin-type N-terminal cleavage/methylation domain-containing protein
MTRRGMTLIEMMVATAATLILMAAVAQVFSVFGSTLADSRSMVELDARMRTVAARLRSDLAGATARPLPPLDPQAGEGYLEIIEGPWHDLTDVSTGTANLITSSTVPVCPTDVDDVLLFTTRNSAAPFVGRAGNGFVESTAAEVAWFARKTVGPSDPVTYTLFRRQLLVLGTPGFAPFITDNTVTETIPNFYQLYDVSVRPPYVSGTISISGSVQLTPNTLLDLTKRESRFLHSKTTTFPFQFVDHQSLAAPGGLIFPSDSARVGEDVILTNVLAFDVRLFDPAAPVNVSDDAAVVPGDPGAVEGTASGAYVNLGNAVTSNSLLTAMGISPHFAGFGAAKSQLVGSATTPRTYDTWSTHYEANGLDEDGTLGPDEGSDGLDNNNDGQVDEIAEQETSAPYPYPLRGIEVRIRCYEPSSRQVRQVTVRHTFVPH